MTTVSFIQKRCFSCDGESRQAETGMRAVALPCDLDTRPSGAPRSSIYLSIQRCPQCGYCAPDIAKGPDGVGEIVSSKKYQKRLLNSQYPEALNAFVCWSFIQEEIGDFAGAAWAALSAAWVCDDDANIRDYAPFWRKEALRLFDQAIEWKQNFGLNESQQHLIRLDILRRCELFKKASELCADLLRHESDERMRMVLEYEEELIEEGDAGKHTIGEALEDIDRLQ